MSSAADRIFSRASVSRVQSALALLLLLVLAVQLARLFWASFAPIGPIGDWRPAMTRSGATPGMPSQGFDPFFRLGEASGPAIVTSLSIKLFGIRVDSATGRGSAIIATPDGIQSSFAVGDEIMPGVTLKQVAFDGVTIERGGVLEQIFLDQSVVAPVVSPGERGGLTAVTGATMQNSVTFVPRVANGKTNGLILSPVGDGAQFNAWGLQRGDVLLAINGNPVTSVVAISTLRTEGNTISLDVERGGRRITLSAKMGQ